jgi:hypothetical protein
MRILAGDCRDVMASMATSSVDAIVTDPPYGIEFMAEGWDHEVPGIPYWQDAIRVAKPGAHLAAFGGTRKWHRLACSIEDAGWEIRDTMLWLYGSGMPHGIDVSKELDKRRDRAELDAILAFTRAIRAARDRAGKSNREIDDLFGFVGMAGHWTSQASQPLIPTVEHWPILRAFLGIEDAHLGAEAWRLNGRKGKPGPDWEKRAVLGEVEVSVNPGFAGDRHTQPRKVRYKLTAPASEAAQYWEGWTTTLKPAWEPIILARKPLVGTIAQNIHTHGVGALNTAGCAIDGGPRPFIERDSRPEVDASHRVYGAGIHGSRNAGTTTKGRHPANVILDETAAAYLDEQTGTLRSGGYPPAGGQRTGAVYGVPNERGEPAFGASEGGASRFFYTAKAGRRERDLGAVKNTHATVKPIALMRWLVRLLTPPDGIVFDPFAGSGTTMVAAALEGVDGVACDLSEVNAETARRRVEACGFEIEEVEDRPTELVKEPSKQRSLF